MPRLYNVFICLSMHVDSMTDSRCCVAPQAAAAEKALEAILEEVKKAEEAVAERKMAFDEVTCACVSWMYVSLI
jgi:hypothetical protein